MTANPFHGVIPVLQTPFHFTGALDLESLAREVEFVCRSGAAGMVFPGFVSEWWKLSEAEIMAAAKVVMSNRIAGKKVFFNVTAQSTYLAAEHAKEFAEMGCDGLMCLLPFVVPRSEADAIGHLSAVLKATELPHILQYSASLTGVNLGVAGLRKLREEYPHLCSIKVDFIPPGPMVTALSRAFADKPFTYLIGFAGLQLADALSRGAHGLMGGAGHVEEDVEVFERLREGSADRFEKLLPLLNLEMQTIDLSIAVHKRLLRDRDILACDHVRAPGPQLDEFQRQALAGHLRSFHSR